MSFRGLKPVSDWGIRLRKPLTGMEFNKDFPSAVFVNGAHLVEDLGRNSNLCRSINCQSI